MLRVLSVIQVVGALPFVLQRGQGLAPFLISLFILAIGAGMYPHLAQLSIAYAD